MKTINTGTIIELQNMDDGGIRIIELTIKNISTGEIFIDEQENEYSSDLMEWSSKNKSDAFNLADLYFKSKY